MRGNRELKRTGCWRAALTLLLALLVVLSQGGPQGAAVSSPAEPSPAAALMPDDAPESSRRAGGPSEPAADDAPAAVPVPEAVPAETAEAVPAVTEPVDDAYFDDAVFLGDSRTDGFRLYSGLNRGAFLCATGATVESVFTRAVDTAAGKQPLLDALADMDCGKIYLMLGVNELGWNGTETFRTQSAALLERLRSDHPEAVIVIQSILPVSAAKDAEGRYVNNGRIDAYNQVWQELAAACDVLYLNVAEAVADGDGRLPEDLSFDGVHLNPAGCRIWLDYLRTHPVGDPVPAEPETGPDTPDMAEPSVPAAVPEAAPAN